MKTYFSIQRLPLLIILFLVTPCISFAGEFKVIRVYDGDTIKAEGHDIEIKVRLVGIDAPETSRKKREPGQPYSQQAKKFLADLILNEIVDIKGFGSDRYGRILDVVYHQGKNINLEMLKAGYPVVYKGKQPHDFDPAPYLEAEQKACEAKWGMWCLEDKYISPKEWRKR